MKQRGNVGKVKRAGAWLLTFVMLLSLVMVPVGKVEAADLVTVTNATDGTNPVYVKIEVEEVIKAYSNADGTWPTQDLTQYKAAVINRSGGTISDWQVTIQSPDASSWNAGWNGVTRSGNTITIGTYKGTDQSTGEVWTNAEIADGKSADGAGFQIAASAIDGATVTLTYHVGESSGTPSVDDTATDPSVIGQQSDKVKAVFTQSNVAGEYHEYYLKINNQTSDSIGDWIVAVPIKGVTKVEDWSSWSKIKTCYTSDYLYIAPVGSAVIPAGGSFGSTSEETIKFNYYANSEPSNAVVYYKTGTSSSNAFDSVINNATGGSSVGGGGTGGSGGVQEDTTTDLGLNIEYNYAKLLQESLYFYDANMCGPEVASKCGLNWRDNCHTADQKASYGGQIVDVSGGFHDAGDHVKFGLAQGYSAATLALGYYEFKDAYDKLGQTDHYQLIMDHFCDYFVNCTVYSDNAKKTGTVQAFCYQVGDGTDGDPDSDHGYWGPPEKQGDNKRSSTILFTGGSQYATDVVSISACALALHAYNFPNSEKSVQYLQTAKDLFAYAKQNTKTCYVVTQYKSDSWEDDYCAAAAALYLATGEAQYLTDMNQYYGSINTGWVLCWNKTWGIAAALKKDWNAVNAIAACRGNIGNSKQGFLIVDGWGSARYNTTNQFLGLLYDKENNKFDSSGSFANWATGQMKYLLGNNKNKRCFVVGYNENSSKYPHHRAASNSSDAGSVNAEGHHVLLGALVGGPSDANDTYADNQADYNCNEVALDYNAGFVGAAAGLYLLHEDDEDVVNTLAPESELSAIGVTKYYGSSSSVTVESIALDKESLTLHVGAEKTLTATVTPEGASIVSWKSSNTEVATVKNGVVTGMGAGEATITATAGGKSVVCQVTVTPLPVAVLNADALSATGVIYGDNKAVGAVSVINSGDGIAGPVSAAFKSGINSDFSLITGQIEAIMPGDTRNITVLPKSNLAVGQYKDVLIVSYFDGKDMQELSIPVSLSIDRRKITVKADDKTKTFGEKNPKLTYSVTSGSIVKGDSLDITCNTTTTETSEVGSYDIIVNAGDNANYDITCEKGTLTISKKAITSIMFPTAGDIEETEMLEASILSGGDTLYGDFAWESPAVILERGIWDVNAVLTLSDDAKKNYSFDEVEGYDEENGIITQKVKVNVSRKGLPKITFPTAETIQIGQSLKDATFKGGSIEYGTFRWEDDAIVPDKVGEYSYNVVFEWSDEYKSKYGIASGDSDEIKMNKVKVLVRKLDNEKEAIPPELVKRTKSTIQVRAEENHEYSIDDGETWGDEAIGETITFEGLKSFTAYTITARIKETETVSASEVSAGLTVYTLVSDPYVIDISNLGNPNYVEALCKESGTSTIEYSNNTLILKESVNYYNAGYTIIGTNPAITIQSSVDAKITLSDASMKEVELEGNGNAGITVVGEVNVTDTISSDDITDIIISGNGTLNTSGIITKGTVKIESGTLVIDASNTGSAAIEAENVVIEDGMVKATGGEGSPAILSGKDVTISGGDVTAVGGAGAVGIKADRVTITGGTIMVTGGAGNTAGIDANKVTITGGTVSVTGQGDQPAIKADNKDIKIEIKETNGTAYREPDKEDKKKLVESITVTISSATIIKDRTATVSAMVLPTDAADKSVIWSSSNPSVATVSQNGIVTAVLEGKTDIIATAKDGSGKSGRVAVTVIDNGQGDDDKAVQATGMTVEADVKGAKNIPVKGTFKLAPKKKMELNVIFLPEDAVEEELTFTSKNVKIAKVDENGIITAGKKAGKTTITVTSENGLKKTFTVQVMKKPIKRVKIKVSKKVVKVKKKLKLKAVLTPNKKQASNVVYWKSSNPKVAVVSASGVVKGVKKGKAKITAVATDGSGKKATVTIQVK